MEFECMNPKCKRKYLTSDSPSDYFCCQGCSTQWTNDQSRPVEDGDDQLDADAVAARHRSADRAWANVGRSAEATGMAFIGYIMAAQRRAESSD